MKPSTIANPKNGRKMLVRYTNCWVCDKPLTSGRASKGETNVCSAECGMIEFHNKWPKSEILSYINWEDKFKSIVTFKTYSKITPRYCVDCNTFIKFSSGKGCALKRCDSCSKARARKARADAKRIGDQTDPKIIEKLRAKNSRQSAMRRARTKHTGDSIGLKALANRDGWICWLCNEPVSKADKHERYNSHIRGPSIDHIIPLSLGGLHLWSNVKLAHFNCNSRRGNRMIETVA